MGLRALISHDGTRKEITRHFISFGDNYSRVQIKGEKNEEKLGSGRVLFLGTVINVRPNSARAICLKHELLTSSQTARLQHGVSLQNGAVEQHPISHVNACPLTYLHGAAASALAVSKQAKVPSQENRVINI